MGVTDLDVMTAPDSDTSAEWERKLQHLIESSWPEPCVSKYIKRVQIVDHFWPKGNSTAETAGTKTVFLNHNDIDREREQGLKSYTEAVGKTIGKYFYNTKPIRLEIETVAGSKRPRRTYTWEIGKLKDARGVKFIN